MYFEWPIYDLRHDGRLYEDVDGRPMLVSRIGKLSVPKFATIAEAEDWLRERDLRGNVR